MPMSVEQTVRLAGLEQLHGHVARVADTAPTAEQILAGEVTGTRVYICKHCKVIFSIEPDGTGAAWFPMPVDDDDE